MTASVGPGLVCTLILNWNGVAENERPTRRPLPERTHAHGAIGPITVSSEETSIGPLSVSASVMLATH